jgi:hypothetical protein
MSSAGPALKVPVWGREIPDSVQKFPIMSQSIPDCAMTGICDQVIDDTGQFKNQQNKNGIKMAKYPVLWP